MFAVVRSFMFAALASAFAATAFAQDSADAVDETEIMQMLEIIDASDADLDTFLWTNRLIVVFAASERDPNFAKQLELLKERPEELLDRDVVVITDTSPQDASAVRLKLRPRAFSMVLIDKDGVVKLRKPSPWAVREIARSIDKTALRQQEVRDARDASQ